MRIIALSIVLLLVSCNNIEKKSDDSPILVRVGESVLTVKMVAQKLPKEHTLKDKLHYIKEWTDMELLAQEARKEEYHEDDEFRKKIATIERDLLAMSYLNDHITKRAASTITTDDMRAYFDKHRNTFLRTEDVLRYEIIILKTTEEAWKVRKDLSAKNFLSRAQKHSIRQRESSEEFVKKSQLPEEVRDYLFEIKEGGIALPRKVGKEIHLYLIVEKGKAGELASFTEVVPLIRSHVVAQKQRDAVAAVTQNLRNREDYYFNSNYFQIDSSKVQPKEEKNE